MSTTETRQITAEDFIQAVGHAPIQDDLERCNCPQAGQGGHMFCGWCSKHNCPKARCLTCWTSTQSTRAT